MKYFIIVLVMLVSSCGTKETVKKVPDDIEYLSQALAQADYPEIERLQQLVRLTENAQNTIALYTMLKDGKLLKLQRKIDYLSQFKLQLNASQIKVLSGVMKWTNLKIIYRDEISPPVRIIQKNKLSLAPSFIDFNLCEPLTESCSIYARKQLGTIMTSYEITSQLKNMSKNDPCVNLGIKPEGHDKATLCLKRNKGNLKIELLEKPRFNYNDWLLVMEKL